MFRYIHVSCSTVAPARRYLLNDDPPDLEYPPFPSLGHFSSPDHPSSGTMLSVFGHTFIDWNLPTLRGRMRVENE